MKEISHLPLLATVHNRTHGLSIFSISADANCFAAAPRKCKQTKLANCHPGGFAYFQTNYFNLIECRFLRWVQSGPVTHQCFGIIYKSQRHINGSTDTQRMCKIEESEAKSKIGQLIGIIAVAV